MARIPFKYNNANFAWSYGSKFPNQSVTPFTWDDCALVQELVDMGPPGDTPIFHSAPEKRKKLIKLICKVKNETYIEEKQIGDVKIKATDIELLAEEVLGINVNIKW